MGRHEAPLRRHEPPRFAKQTEPQLCSNEHAQHIKMCLCNTGGFLNLFYEEIHSDQENEIIRVKDMQLLEKLLLSYNLFNHKTAI